MSDTLELDQQTRRIIDPNNVMTTITKEDLKPFEDPDYKKYRISKTEYITRYKEYMEAKAIYGQDPLFNQIFGWLAPENSIQFLSIDDMMEVAAETSEKELVEVAARNPTHARLLRKLKQRKKDLDKLKEKNLIE